MEVTALCIRLVIHVLLLLVAEDQHCYCTGKADAAFLHVAQNKLQFFEYDSISFDCEGFDDFTEWRVMRRIMGVETICRSKWETSWGRCFIKNAFESVDSGEYWCEANGTMSSNSVTISVTAGSVIMESPALPVTEGDNVTLSCRNKTASSVPIADFYKDDNLLKTGYEGHITIHNVSKSDEGHYKCNIVTVGESAQSRLTVRAPPSLHEDSHPSLHHSPHLFILCITVALCLVALLFVGLCLCGRYRVLVCFSKEKMSLPRSQSGETQTVSGPAGVVQPQGAMYSLSTAVMSCTEPGVFTATPFIDTWTATTNESTTYEGAFYYTID